MSVHTISAARIQRWFVEALRAVTVLQPRATRAEPAGAFVTPLRQWHRGVVAVALLLAGIAGCDKGSNPTTPVSPTPPSFPGSSTTEAIFVGAGDINMCNQPGATVTAALLDKIPGTVFTVGDNAYMTGSTADFQCYDRTWGRHKSRTYATPGNHDYESPGAAPYFEYFGERAGPPGFGYYSYDLASWHIISLNSQVPMGEGSEQLAWLRGDLHRSRAACVAAIIHHPLISSGPNGDNPTVRDLWRSLIDNGVDMVISAHDHLYERHARIDQDGRPAQRGARLFIVGTGGATLYHNSGLRPTTEAKVAAWGVIKFTLLPGSYRWDFHTAEGIVDSGIDLCH